MKTRRALLGCIFALWPALGAVAQERSITVASTTSTEQSVCSVISCRRSRPEPAFRSGSSRSAPDKRSTSAGAGMPTWFSCTTGPRRTPSWRRGSPHAATTSCTTISSSSGRRATSPGRPAATSPRRCAGSRPRSAVHLARRSVRHACRGVAVLAGGRRRSRQERVVQGDRARHGPGPERSLRVERVSPDRSRHLAVVSEPR